MNIHGPSPPIKYNPHPFPRLLWFGSSCCCGGFAPLFQITFPLCFSPGGSAGDIFAKLGGVGGVCMLEGGEERGWGWGQGLGESSSSSSVRALKPKEILWIIEHLHTHMAHALIAHAPAEFLAEIKQTTAMKKKNKPKKGTKGWKGD